MSDTKNETIAAILAEMREGDVRATLSPPDVTTRERVVYEIMNAVLEGYADRIEAALERERIKRDKVSFRCGDCAKFGCDCDAGDVDGNEDCIACEKFVRRYASPGNAAAMRDLLEKIRHEYGLGLIGCRTCVSSEDDAVRVSELFEKQIDAALAAHARNVDRYNKHDAPEAFAKEFSEGNVDPDKCDCMVLDEFMRENWWLYNSWLFAPAEGGAV